jgi:hypothetical protein
LTEGAAPTEYRGSIRVRNRLTDAGKNEKRDRKNRRAPSCYSSFRQRDRFANTELHSGVTLVEQVGIARRSRLIAGGLLEAL